MSTEKLSREKLDKNFQFSSKNVMFMIRMHWHWLEEQGLPLQEKKLLVIYKEKYQDL